MKRFIWQTLLASSMIAGLMGVSYAQHMGNSHGKTVTVTGELVDVSCYIGMDMRGADHKQCAEMCIKKGLPMGIVTKDGKFYLLLSDHAKENVYNSLKAKAAETVTVSGILHEKDGTKGITVTAVR